MQADRPKNLPLPTAHSSDFSSSELWEKSEPWFKDRKNRALLSLVLYTTLVAICLAVPEIPDQSVWFFAPAIAGSIEQYFDENDDVGMQMIVGVIAAFFLATLQETARVLDGQSQAEFVWALSILLGSVLLQYKGKQLRDRVVTR